MKDIEKFTNDLFGEIRILEQDDGKVLFCGKDVADALGYAIPSKAINTHCKGVSKLEAPTKVVFRICYLSQKVIYTA